MLVTSSESMISSLWVGFFDLEDAPWIRPLTSLCLASLSLWRRSLRLRSASGSRGFPDLSSKEDSELRRSRRCLASGGSAKISSPCGGSVGFPPFNRLCSSSFDRDGRWPAKAFLGFTDGGTFSDRSGRVEFGGAIAGCKLLLLGLSSRDRLFWTALISKLQSFSKH